MPHNVSTLRERGYSKEGLHLLSKKLNHLNDFPFTAKEQIERSIELAGKLSIQGVQPKLSIKLIPSQKALKTARIEINNEIFPKYKEWKKQAHSSQDITQMAEDLKKLYRTILTVQDVVNAVSITYSKSQNSKDSFSKDFNPFIDEKQELTTFAKLLENAINNLEKSEEKSPTKKLFIFETKEQANNWYRKQLDSAVLRAGLI